MGSLSHRPPTHPLIGAEHINRAGPLTPDQNLVRGPAQLDFTVGGLKPISEGHSFYYAGAPYKCLYGGAPYKSPKIVENRRKSPKIRASGRPPRVTHITTNRKIRLRRPIMLHSSCRRAEHTIVESWARPAYSYTRGALSFKFYFNEN